MASPRSLFALCLLLVVGCADPIPEGPICDGAILVRALEAAQPGDVVEVGSCRVETSLSVPSGVTLVGAGAGESILAPSGTVTLQVAGSTDPANVTTVRGLTIEASAVIGLSIDGPGDALVESVEILGTLGYGMRAVGVGEITLMNVTATGPVTAASSMDAAFTVAGRSVGFEETATVGIAIYDTERAVLGNVRVEGFAELGVGFLGVADVDWSGGSASRNIGGGIYSDGASMILDGVDVCETFTGGRTRTTIAIIAVDSGLVGGRRIETASLTMDDNGGMGLLQVGVAGTHVDLAASGNRDAAVWAANTTSLEVRGASTAMMDNDFAGIFVAQVENVSISDAAIGGSRTVPRMVPDGGALAFAVIGDGIVLGQSPTISISNVALMNNERAGLVVDLDGGDGSGLSIDAVSVEGAADSFGALAGEVDGLSFTPGAPAGWDTGVTRDANTIAAEAALASGEIDFFNAAVPAGSDIPDGLRAGMGLPL